MKQSTKQMDIVQISDLDEDGDDYGNANKNEFNESVEVVVKADFSLDEFDEAVACVRNKDLIVDSSSADDDADTFEPANEYELTVPSNYHSNQQVIFAPSPLQLYKQPSSSLVENSSAQEYELYHYVSPGGGMVLTPPIDEEEEYYS